MYERILKRMQKKILVRQYVMTLHAEEEMNDDSLTIFDIEHTILTGKIIERQEDYYTSEWKYLIQGETMVNYKVVVVTKLSPTDKLVIITVYLE